MSASRGHGERVLVADDSEANRELLFELLTAEGYQVVPAANGSQALEHIRSGSIDLALLDVVMPRPSGFEICQSMKTSAETRLTPVVLLTSLNSEGDKIRGIMCGADDFLTKPVNKHELLARVYSLLRLKQFTDELDNAESVLFSLALTIEAKDPYTEGHCDRLSKCSVEASYKVFEMDLPDVVLLDINLGGENGLDLVAWMRRKARLDNIPVIAITAHALATEQERILKAGCVACLSKPIDFKDLRGRLQHWLLYCTASRPHS